MISSAIIGSLAVAAVLTFLAPIIILIVLCAKRVISTKPMWFGVLAFFVSQICLRLPILSLLKNQSWFLTFSKQNAIVYIVAIAFTAGLFEETARFIGARFCLKPAERRYCDAVAFGLGHGFCECVLIVGLTEVSNLINCIALNSGALSTSSAVGAQVATTMAGISAPLVLMAIWERISTVMFHLAATIFVFRGVREKKIGWYLFALAAHTVADSVPTLLASSNVVLSEIITFAIGLLLMIFAVRMKPKFQETVRLPHDAFPNLSV